MTGKSEDHEVAKAAFELWEKEGRPDGRSEEHWHRAKAMLDAKDSFADPPDAKKRAPRAKAAPKAEAAPAAKPAKTSATAKPPAEKKPRAPRKPKAE